MGVFGSGLLANTTSTYSNCNRSSEAFSPANAEYKYSLKTEGLNPTEIFPSLDVMQPAE